MIFSSRAGIPSPINFFDLTVYKPTPRYISIFGNVNAVSTGIAAAKVNEPSAVTFTRSGAFIRLSLWQARTSGSVEFHFKTLEPHGLLVSHLTCRFDLVALYTKRSRLLFLSVVYCCLYLHVAISRVRQQRLCNKPVSFPGRLS